MEKTLKFKTNISCGGCVATVGPYLDASESVHHWSVDTNSPDKILTVQLTAGDSATVKDLVAKSGYEIEEMN